MTGSPVSQWVDGSLGDWALLALALYGLVNLMTDCGAMLGRKRQARTGVGISVLVLIHNQEHQIEGLVRSLATKEWPCQRPGSPWELLVVDLESTDNTPMILQRLAEQYEHMRLVTLPKDQVCTAGEAALFLCRSPVALLVDLRHQIDAERISQTLANW